MYRASTYLQQLDMSMYADLEAKIATTNASEDSRIVADYAEIVDMGFKHGLLYKRKLTPDQGGVHRGNRDGAVVCGRAVAQIWDDVDRVGVSPDLFKDATSFEEPPNKENEIKFIKRCECDEFLVVPIPGEFGRLLSLWQSLEWYRLQPPCKQLNKDA
jgi:hypothetical protein